MIRSNVFIIVALAVLAPTQAVAEQAPETLVDLLKVGDNVRVSSNRDTGYPDQRSSRGFMDVPVANQTSELVAIHLKNPLIGQKASADV